MKVASVIEAQPTDGRVRAASGPPVRVRLDLAYDGTAYAGWQLQPTAPTIQSVLESTLAVIVGHPVRVHGSGRTDRGVHARQQVAHADLSTRMPSSALTQALNARLPPDIRIWQCRTVAATFDARRTARAKEYRYRIWNATVVPPEHRRYVAHVPCPLDVERMRQAARLFCGTHDFSAFSANPRREVPDPVRTVYRFSLHGRGRWIELRVLGDGFLYKMVRSMVGFLLRIGQGDEDPQAVRDVLETRQRTARVPTAAPHGLFLWRVLYRSVIIDRHACKDLSLSVGGGFRPS